MESQPCSRAGAGCTNHFTFGQELPSVKLCATNNSRHALVCRSGVATWHEQRLGSPPLPRSPGNAEGRLRHPASGHASARSPPSATSELSHAPPGNSSTTDACPSKRVLFGVGWKNCRTTICLWKANPSFKHRRSHPSRIVRERMGVLHLSSWTSGNFVSLVFLFAIPSAIVNRPSQMPSPFPATPNP